MKIRTISVLFSIILLIGIGLYGIFVEPRDVGVHHVFIHDSVLARVLKNKVVVHVSDLHTRRIDKREQKVLALMEDLRPDLIFITGDYVKWNGDYEPALNFLSRVRARIGAWAITGDYDYSNSRKSCHFCHEKGSGKPKKRHQVKFLRKGFEEIKLQGGSLWIGALESENHGSYEAMDKIKLPEGGVAVIVLCHNPLSFDRVDGMQDVLILAGDTHGGQVPIPGWVWKILGYEKNARFSYGLFEKGNAKMFVSKGVGTSHVPIRILRRPEVVVLHFQE